MMRIRRKHTANGSTGWSGRVGCERMMHRGAVKCQGSRSGLPDNVREAELTDSCGPFPRVQHRWEEAYYGDGPFDRAVVLLLGRMPETVVGSCSKDTAHRFSVCRSVRTESGRPPQVWKDGDGQGLPFTGPAQAITPVLRQPLMPRRHKKQICVLETHSVQLRSGSAFNTSQHHFMLV